MSDEPNFFDFNKKTVGKTFDAETDLKVRVPERRLTEYKIATDITEDNGKKAPDEPTGETGVTSGHLR